MLFFEAEVLRWWYFSTLHHWKDLFHTVNFLFMDIKTKHTIEHRFLKNVMNALFKSLKVSSVSVIDIVTITFRCLDKSLVESIIEDHWKNNDNTNSSHWIFYILDYLFVIFIYCFFDINGILIFGCQVEIIVSYKGMKWNKCYICWELHRWRVMDILILALNKTAIYRMGPSRRIKSNQSCSCYWYL